MNKVILMGRLCADPELKQTQSGVAVCAIRIAVNRRFADKDGKREADFFDVVCWRQTAEFVARYFAKGRLIAVVGSLQTRTWTDNNGGKRYATEVVADEVYFAHNSTIIMREYTPATRADFAEADEEDEGLPF